MNTAGGEFRQRLDRVEGLVQSVEGCPDPATREAARELVRALLDLHAAGLARILELATGEQAERMAADRLVSGLLLLHGLHPHPAAVRVAAALDGVRPRLRALGGEVELVEASEERVCVRLRGDPAAGESVRAAVEEAVIEAVPDLVALEVEEAWESSAVRVPLPVLACGPGHASRVGGAPRT